MDQDQSSAVPEAARFDSTRWTVVLEAAQSRAPGGPAALARLCARYWPPLYGFARRRVERSKGRFRSFLLASFRKFMANETRRAGAEKRGGRVEIIRLDWRDEEGGLRFEPQDPLTAETLYDARWALLLERTVEDPNDVEAELRSLREALVAAESRVQT